MNKKLFKINAICVLMALFFARYTFAANFSIIPSAPLPTTVVAGKTVSAYFTVTNRTNTTRNGYVVQGLPVTVTQNTSPPNCTHPINLGPHASCQLQLDINGAVSTDLALCRGNSCTTIAHPLSVSLSTEPAAKVAKFAYITSFTGGSPYVSVCPLDPVSGHILSCANAGGDAVFNGLPIQQIVINNSGTVAYITNGNGLSSTPYVYQCQINPLTGEFFLCTSTSIVSPIDYIAYNGGIALNPDNSIAYIADNNNGVGRMLACPIIGGVIDGNCTDTGIVNSISYYAPQIAVNQAGTTAYVANFATPMGVSVCTVNGAAFTSCIVKTDINLINGGGTVSLSDGVSGVALNHAETIIYMTIFGADMVYACPATVDNNTTLNDCFIASSSITLPWNIVINAANTAAYITDFSNNTYSCTVHANGMLSSCLTNTDVFSPAGVALGY